MRRIIAATVALAITLVLPLVAPQTAQAASKKTKVSISVSATKLSQGKFLTIKGKVKPALAGRTVVLQHKMDGAGWKNEVTLTTAADGSYSSTGQVNKLQNRYYRVYAPKFKKYKKAYSKAIYVKVTAPVQQATSVAITTAPASVNAGDSFTVTGTASANLIGKSVVLSASNTSGSWDVASAGVAGDGTFSITGSITTAGAGQTLTVYAPSTSTTLYSQSGSASVDVYGWYYLRNRDVVQGSIYKAGITINGVFYGNTVYHSLGYYDRGPTSGQFDLGRKCRTFAATVGWSDSSNSSEVGVATVSKDSVTIWTQSGIKFGTSTPVTIDISGALRLGIQSQWTSGGDGNLSYGDARILCAF